MYAYTHDAQTGGLLLNDSTMQFSGEPRPVYYRELDMLGFDKHWNYDKQDQSPYMWAEANCYWYRGRMVAKTKGGSLYTAPKLEFALDRNGQRVLPDGERLTPVDIAGMVENNRELLKVIEQITIRKIFDVYKRYKHKVDCFHVAFSGGKDSIVLLELVKKALPKSGFVVVFGDTGMEFPDTYDVIDIIEERCRAEAVGFYRASSHLKPEESWRLFGPPSRVLRWCCYVHKSAPQTMKLREVLGKANYKGLAFVGVRAQESATRAEYDYENYGKKQKGQYSHNSILEWTSAEVWLYIFMHNLVVNEAYKMGNPRAGCLFCPMVGKKSDYIRRVCYPAEINKYIEIITDMINEDCIMDYKSYIVNGGWESRGSGRDLKDNHLRYKEELNNGLLQITITNPLSNWREWIKTIDELPFQYKIEKHASGYTIKIPANINKTYHSKQIKQVFRRAAYCVGCRVCEANCCHGCISFNGGLNIENCIHCGECQNISYGCLIADCLKKPMGGKGMRSLNTFEEHAPKPEWISDFFERQNAFLGDNHLGPNQRTKFKRFLSDALLINKNSITDFMLLISRIGWETEQAWGLILIQLIYNNPQMEWYIRNMPVGMIYPRGEVEGMLINVGQSKKMAGAIVLAFGRLCALPLGTKLNFGTVSLKGKQIVGLGRSKSIIEDNRVVLYALYKFAEACDGYYQFTLSRLLDHSVESAGLSPTQIFGFDRDDMQRFLLGLTAQYPEFINAAFTHDLDKITLREDKTSADVLTLFEEDGHE